MNNTITKKIFVIMLLILSVSVFTLRVEASSTNDVIMNENIEDDVKEEKQSLGATIVSSVRRLFDAIVHFVQALFTYLFQTLQTTQPVNQITHVNIVTATNTTVTTNTATTTNTTKQNMINYNTVIYHNTVGNTVSNTVHTNTVGNTVSNTVHTNTVGTNTTVITNTVGAPHNHSYELISKGTCQNGGMDTYRCRTCGATDRRKATGEIHQYKISYYDRGKSGHSELKICELCNKNVLSDYIEPHYFNESNVCVCGHIKTGDEDPVDPTKITIVSEDKRISDSQFDEVHRNGSVYAGFIKSRSGSSSKIVVFFPGSGETTTSVSGHRNPLTQKAYAYDVLILQFTGNNYYSNSSNISNSLKFVQNYVKGGSEVILVGYSNGGYGAFLVAEQMLSKYPNAKLRVKLLDGYVNAYAGKDSGQRIKDLLNKKVKVDLYSSSQEGSTIAQRGDNANHEEFYRIGGYTYTSFKNNPNYNTHGKLQNLLNEIANGNK